MALQAAAPTSTNGAAEGPNALASDPAPGKKPARRRASWHRGLVAYLLWALFGISGAHHLYLGRNRAALLCSVSCGGFGLGWLADAFRIPRYVCELADGEAATVAARHAARPTPTATSLEDGPPADDDGAVTRAAETTTAVAAVATAPVDLHASRAGAAAGDDGETQSAGSPSLAGTASVGTSSALLLWTYRTVWQLSLGAWITFTLLRLATDDTLSAHPALRASVHAIAALLSISIAAGEAGLPLPYAKLLSAAFIGSALEWRHGRRVGVTKLNVVTMPMLLCSLVANAAAWRRSPARQPPRRSWKGASAAVLIGALFWLAVAVGALMRVKVSLDSCSRPQSSGPTLTFMPASTLATGRHLGRRLDRDDERGDARTHGPLLGDDLPLDSFSSLTYAPRPSLLLPAYTLVSTVSLSLIPSLPTPHAGASRSSAVHPLHLSRARMHQARPPACAWPAV